MAELVAGAFLSSFLEVAFERLASCDFFDYFRRRKLDDGLLTKLHVILISVNKIMEDAEERQYRDHCVKQWLDELKDQVFKAQDLLDDIATEASRQNLHAESQNFVTRKVRGFFTSVDQNQFDKEIETGIQGVLGNLEYLMRQNEILGLREGPSAGLQLGVNRKLYQRLPTTHLIDESKMCGRDADKESIVKILLSPNTYGMGGNQLPMDVIAITGMGGMGKTTLARLVYEDRRMKDRFQHTAWVCVSDEFDAHQVTKAILQSLNCSTEKLTDFDSYQRELKEILKGKEFFLVLDDVWNENHKIWEVFQAPLKHVAPHSKILITTRNETVAQVMCCNFIHALEPLEEGDCRKLFAKHAFDNQDEAAHPDLVEIGAKIVNRCGGLPLAIKTLASLLHSKLSLQYWNKILNSDIWELSENDSNIIPSLRLSYHYLPSNLKRCFAYCSIFPKDYDVKKNELIQLWMADGLIYPIPKSMSLEEVGNEMFSDLESRSFFEPSGKGDDHFTMHDLVNDLAKSVAQEFFVQLEFDQAQGMSTKTRYFSYVCKDDGYLELPKEVFKCHRLRSFLLLNRGLWFKFGKDIDIMSRLSRLKCIRELSLYGCENIKSLSDGISNLKHLHYLDLSRTEVRKLPESMCLLINLQTLKLKGCYRLTKLPSNLFKLINLRHLDLEHSPIRKMPKHMGRLNQLRTMNGFAVSKRRGSNIKELGALKHLTGSLTITNMKSIKDATDVREANLKEKELDTLKLIYSDTWSNYGGKEAQRHEQLLEAVEPNRVVKDLTIGGYRGTKFWKGLGGLDFLPDLVSLNLLGCTNIVRLPPLGQLPFLQKLTIERFDGIKVISEEFYGNGSLVTPFPSLSSLKFSYMAEWEEWEIHYEGESFPCLEELRIHYCPRLTKSLPQYLPSLKTLEIMRCGNLEATLPKSPSMEKLYLDACEKITVKQMPTWSISDVPPPLHHLTLMDCPAMESLPKGVMLSSLHRLSIFRCPKVIELGREWSLHELSSLKELVIFGDFEDGRESFPEEGLLPPNLQSLSILDCDNLKRINHRGLAHLRSLTSLSFRFCPSMSFEGMPQDAFPPSLSHLLIDYGCPLLTERCEKEKGLDWPLIAHIPHVFDMTQGSLKASESKGNFWFLLRIKSSCS